MGSTNFNPRDGSCFCRKAYPRKAFEKIGHSSIDMGMITLLG